MKFFTKIGLYGLVFSLNSTVRGSVAVTESMYSHTVEKLTEAVLPSSKVKTTSSAVRSDPSDHLVPSCSGSTMVLIVRLLQLLGQSRVQRAVDQVEAQQALVDQLALALRPSASRARRERVEALRRTPLEAGHEQRLPGRTGTSLRSLLACAATRSAPCRRRMCRGRGRHRRGRDRSR